ncbi:hypothetical protein ACHAW5_003247 [Stephanodiscus triporus]|uniref:Uncharacterized protein n=1 Tax=Stephanodiscus triporus TaxID=2934178 RepID=A0ABD3NCY6_9STRA
MNSFVRLCNSRHRRSLMKPQIDFKSLLINDHQFNDCLMTIDGTDFRIQQKGAAKMGTHSAPTSMQLGIDILKGNLVWVEGPYPAGAWPDLKIFLNTLAGHLLPGECVEADNGYVGHPDKIKCPNNNCNHAENLEMHLVTGPDRWHEGEESSMYTTRQLGAVAESQWFNILAQIISNTLLFILVFGMSATVDVKHLRQQVNNKFAIMTGVGIQYIIMPLVGFLTVITLKSYLTEPMAISLLIVTSSPGGSYSNWWCSLFKADLALSVTLTAVSTILSLVMLPANLLLYVNAAFGFGSDDGGKSILGNIDWASLFISVAVVIFAVGLGLCASIKISSHRFNTFANQLGSLSGIMMIIFSAILSSLSGKSEAQIWGQPWSFYVGVTSPCLLGLFFATNFALVARLRKPEVVSVGVEGAYQNVGIATSAVVAMFDDPIDRGQALCVPLFYGAVEAVLIGIYCIICWKIGWTKAPTDVNFCTMITTTYEVDDDSQRSETVGGQMVEQDLASAVISPLPIKSLTSWERPWSLLFRHMKKIMSPETRNSSQPPIIASFPHVLAIHDGMGTIYPTVVSTAPDAKSEYSRCRINSDESTGRTDVTVHLSDTA